MDDQPGRTMDYDPMVYDVMREVAARLRGEYVARERAAATEADRQRWAQANLDVAAEVDAVDVYDEQAVRAETAELRERLRSLLAECAGGQEMPVESALHGMPTRFEPVTFDQMARFEAAEDILNQHVGAAMARVYAEERKAVPDQGVVDEMHRRAEELVSARRALSAEDRAAVDEVLTRARAVTEELEGA